jgi:hypothetical protein
MDIFKLGVRDIFGIVLPGAVLLFVIIYVFWTLPPTLGIPALDISLLKDQGLLLSIVFFVASYLLGYLLRMGTADQVDRESSQCLLKEWRRRKENQYFEEGFEQLLNQMRQGKDFEEGFEQLLNRMRQREDVSDSDIRTAFDDWLWRAEPFPYPVWHLRKAALNYPREIYEFFNQHKRGMGLVPDSLWIKGHQFFNYCKLVISKEDEKLREEINAAEGSTRFLGGTYSALKLSIWIFVILLTFQLIAMAVLHIKGISVTDLARSHLASLALSTLLLAAGSRAAQIYIKRYYHDLRLREADIVYGAFYLVCQKKSHDAKSPCNPETTRATFSEDG